MSRKRRRQRLPDHACAECGSEFRRLERTVDGITYWLTGCPVCMEKQENVEAMDALMRAARTQHAEEPRP